ncbi:rod shape-determining protein [Candidatus Woesebacteria bacterium RIFCSPHIGHO2_02_FULL_38_9]|uniref:Cell shape-determining protein MreB n=1 Tax=Candidatus Woesebacteria bacterium RIFCSPHIGHO2_01_FULL_39_28 TaxID=1802496 RepID=A0A1F7YFM8_9BACT|nr:MAG: rod shape-determining protein [Candidatus Woesebacteria bacterium RIFCSPHIGHO2_01_FULL_39_28]OGM35329.1 MAG: rod shape-determining protein [Candidatus Woesebacteria bacterium RIFCSPHIGHO2_02_FULL_38_9]OGM58554.1 MAG: rod shape-determining protein [Candidatus Woesebacteria bacterium RIFCSPLOWO2_01_FULL_38_20]
MILNRLLGLLSHDIGIDLGTANTLVYVRGKGIVIRESSAVARQRKTKEILAIGSSAKKMFGKTPNNIEVVMPLKDGVIADFDATVSMLNYYIKKVHESGTLIPKIPKPKVVIGIPSGVTEVERRAVAKATLSAGAREAYLIEEPMAAAIGAKLPVEEPGGTFVVDIGGGTTEIALISLGGIVLGRSVRVAGNEMDEAILNYVRLKYSVLLGLPTAENVKISIASAISQGKEKFAVVRGRDLETGLPKSIKLRSDEVREALSEIIQQIVLNIKDIIEEAPPELTGDIMEKGIVMAGGGSLLSGIDKVIAQETNVPVSVADDPLTCVVRGCGMILEDRKLLLKIRR